MTQIEEIKDIIREMMKQEMENFNEAADGGYVDDSPAPVVYMTLQVLLAKIQKIEERDRNKPLTKAEEFIKDCTKTCSNELVADGWNNGVECYREWITPEQALRAVELVREEIMNSTAEMVVGYWMSNGLKLDVDETENPFNLNEGDKIKIIITKED